MEYINWFAHCLLAVIICFIFWQVGCYVYIFWPHMNCAANIEKEYWESLLKCFIPLYASSTADYPLALNIMLQMKVHSVGQTSFWTLLTLNAVFWVCHWIICIYLTLLVLPVPVYLSFSFFIIVKKSSFFSLKGRLIRNSQRFKN